MHVAPPAGKWTLPYNVLAMACSKAPGREEKGEKESRRMPVERARYKFNMVALFQPVPALLPSP